ncbi:MAG TPA: hypothetical protein DCG47_13345 [Spirochaetaceae bacterium]|nr:hypothetical protein [Spirochaetaceae bacterium]
MILKLILGSIVVAAAVIGAIIANGAEVGVFAYLALLPPMLLMPLGMLTAGPGFKAIGELFFLIRFGGGERDRNLARATLRFFDKSLAMTAILCFIVHFTAMLKNLADKDAIWPNLAWALAPSLFALVIHVAVSLPLTHAVEASGTVESSPAPAETKPSFTTLRLFGGMAVALAGIVSFSPASFASWLFVDLSSFLIIIFIPLGMLLAATGSASFKRAWASLNDPEASLESLRKARLAYRYLALSFRSAAMVGAGMGFVLMVKDFLERTRVGPSVALIVISALWSLLLMSVVALPLEAAAERRSLEIGGAAFHS